MDNLIAAYLMDRKDKLNDLYQWKFSPEVLRQRLKIEVDGASWLEKTRELKAALGAAIAADMQPPNLVRIAEYFIREWGGIARFSKAETMVEVFTPIMGTATIPSSFKPPFQSISSWSKWVSLICPQWGCIYDARVAYSINAINYLNGGAHKLFPLPPGRNSRLQILDVPTLLLSTRLDASDGSSPKSVRAKYFVRKSTAYKEYLQLVANVSQKLWNDREHIHDVEMLLFALADTVVYEDVFRKLQDSNTKASLVRLI